MRKLSSRMLAMLVNLTLVLAVLCVSVVCLLLPASEVSSVKDGVYDRGQSENGVSLTFNVYEGTETVKGILSVLEEHGAKATFFIGGCWADDNVETVKLIAQKGHEIGSHGYFHRAHDKLTFAQNQEEIQTSINYLTEVTGLPVTLFAPPSGAYSDETVRAAQSLGCKTVLWSKDTIDWRDKECEVTLRRATEGVDGGDIVLMHPMAHTLQALPKILENYASRGLKCIPVGENIADTAT